tara:strand:- start:84 stop:590 length:507 start_codon:yes stop_codon:yes gene_type:complete
MPFLGKSPEKVGISDGTITAAKIADDAITSAKIDDNAVIAAAMADDAIGIDELSASGTANATTFLRGDNSWAASGGLYNAWLVKTTTYTAVSGDQLIANHASTAFTITLPASPSQGDTVVLKNVGAALLTVGRNSEKIDSVAEDATMPTGNAVQLVFTDDAAIGWAIL